jgi:hypothetical protein
VLELEQHFSTLSILLELYDLCEGYKSRKVLVQGIFTLLLFISLPATKVAERYRRDGFGIEIKLTCITAY